MLSLVTQPEQVLQQLNTLRNGTPAQRRALLRLRALPLPDDLAAVAVLGTAVLDLPKESPTLASTSRRGADIFDPLHQLAERYRGSHVSDDESGEDSTSGIDYSAFLEVLCPNGTSLLERLPISPALPRKSSKGALASCKDTQEVLSEPPHHVSTSQGCGATLTPSHDASTRDTVATPKNCMAGPQGDALEPACERECKEHKKGVACVDAPVSLQDPARVTEKVTPAASSIQQVDSQPNETHASNSNNEDGTDDNDDIGAPEIFVSAGSLTLSPPRHHRRHHPQRSRHSSVRPSPTSCHASRQPSFGGNGHLSSHGRSGPTSVVDDSTPALTPTHSIPLAPPATVHQPCNLAGRVLLTDRLMKSQLHTALPTMVEAYRQYVQAASANTQYLFSPSSSSSASGPRRRVRISEKEQWAIAQQTLAPRQRGIVLETNNRDEEAAKCVSQAVQCERPSFRYIDPAELYGTSSYRSNTFNKQGG